MAELLLKVDANAGYANGDILCAFNSWAIRCCHAQHICHVKQATRNSDGLILPTHVSKDWYEATHQFRFDRISRTEIRRTNLLTLEEDSINETLNDKGEQMDVPSFIERRRRMRDHILFGTVGRETWYGGKKDFSNAKLAIVWNAIETKTPHREVNFQRWPMQRLDVRQHLPIRVDDFNERIAAGMVEPRYLTNFAGEFAWESTAEDETVIRVFSNEQPPEDAAWVKVSEEKRRRKVDWENVLSLTAGDLTDARNREKVFDIRERNEYSRSSVVEVKV